MTFAFEVPIWIDLMLWPPPEFIEGGLFSLSADLVFHIFSFVLIGILSYLATIAFAFLVLAILIAFKGFLFIVELLTRRLIEYPKGTTFIVSAIVTSAGAILRLLT